MGHIQVSHNVIEGAGCQRLRVWQPFVLVVIVNKSFNSAAENAADHTLHLSRTLSPSRSGDSPSDSPFELPA